MRAPSSPPSPRWHLCLFIVMSCGVTFTSATASAQHLVEDPGAPPPRPLSERQDVETVERTAYSDPESHEMNWPKFVPTASLMGHIGLLNEEFDLPGFGLWLGANYYPWPDRYNAFWSLGIKLERNQELRDRPFSLVPTVRSGFAALKGNPHTRKNQIFANVQIYALLGRHIPYKGMPSFWRAGMGVISPRLAPANAMMLLWGVPLPNQIELALDISPDGQTRDLLFMLGIGI